MKPEIEREENNQPNRRRVLETAAGAMALGLSAVGGSVASAAEPAGSAKRITKGRIKQSIVHWCFEKYWDVPTFIKITKQLGCTSIELIDPKYFPLLKEAGLECAIATIDMSPEPPFVKGFNNPKYRDKVFKATRDAIDACAEYGFKNVICFTGMKEDIADDVGAANCVEGFKQIIGHAEKKKVTLCLEMLNTRDRSHPMKGHPGYQGDHTEYCIDIIKRVGSPNLKLLFDIYHVQIMDGDVIRRLREHKDYIGHVHTAGNPGRGELDAHQEIAFPAIMEALLEIGYQGYVGQEFIPTRDPLAGLEQAVTLCDV
ncbi:hydroxypyruvate isomerase family protein [Singulisphaera sp. PoT]|uniref:hydroxypyruvate isomerase family protein n=1 Tax=Singulisphaera sp. PoT TaxID=3411797 RepID=UPI003BF5C207